MSYRIDCQFGCCVYQPGNCACCVLYSRDGCDVFGEGLKQKYILFSGVIFSSHQYFSKTIARSVPGFLFLFLFF
jgi:hypothetical protein